MPISTTDLTFHTDRTGNMVTGKNNEYITNIIQMLFTMKPGTDEYDLERGLDIFSHRFKSEVAGTRDTAYEVEIASQLSKYTDFIPINVVAMYTSSTLYIAMTLQYGSELLTIQVTSAGVENISVIMK